MLRVAMLMAAFVALVAFSVVLAELTLTPSPASAGIAGSNLHPGHSLRQYMEDYTFLGACKQVGGNLVLGAPFGLILPVLLPRRLRMLRVVLLTAVVMVLVELAQGAIVEGRAFDIDDVILNTTGAFLAYVLLGRRIGRRYHRLAEDPAPVAAPEPDGAADETEARRRYLPGFARRAAAEDGAPAAGTAPRTTGKSAADDHLAGAGATAVPLWSRVKGAASGQRPARSGTSAPNASTSRTPEKAPRTSLGARLPWK